MSSLYIEKRAREDCDNASKINDCGTKSIVMRSDFCYADVLL